MKAIRSHHFSRSTCLALIAIMVSSLATPWLSVAMAQGAPKTVLVLPVSASAENVPGDLVEHALGALTMALDDIKDYDAMQFSSTSPSVRRAVSEGRIRQVDVQENANDLGTALSMGAALRADYVVLSSIQSYSRKDNPASVELILSGQMYEIASSMNPTTGEPVAEPKVFRAFGVSGASSPRAKFTGRETVLAQEALRAAAAKAADTLSGRTDVGQTSAKKKTSPGYKWLLLGLLVAGVAIAVGGGGHGDGGTPAADAARVQSLRVLVLSDSIRLTWNPPTGTTLTVLNYQVWRTLDGNQGTFARVDQGNLLPTTTTFNDYDLQTGTHDYQYFVRVVYTSGALSDYTPSGTFTVTQ